jgi:hypothetical protein
VSRTAVNSSSASSATVSTSLKTCRRCKQRFSEATNSQEACRYHPALYSGGEVAKVRKDTTLSQATTRSSAAAWAGHAASSSAV